ncbi:MAG: acyl-CoA dehydrogenase family protein [Myxococcales bacterium]|nr:acyl-CoA dehydrogenase family protein [Myxococcales bacterium]
MRFDLDDDARMLQQMARDVAQRSLAPHAAAWAQTGAVPRDTLDALAALGLFGVCAPEKLGGAGMSVTALTVALEEIAAVEAGLAVTLLTHNALCIGHLLSGADRALALDWVPRLASGAALGTWAGGAVDSGHLTAGAEFNRGRWRLHGSLGAVPRVKDADMGIVVAATGPNKATAFVLEGDEWQARPTGTLGLDTAGHGELIVEGLVLTDERRVGEPGEALLDEAAIMPTARVGRAAIAVGIARAALEAGTRYATERKQFGKAIAEFQAIQWMIADSAAELDAARLLVRRAAATIDGGADGQAEGAAARVFAVETARAVADRALQIHGGYGFTREYSAERHYRDAHQVEMGEGTDNALQRLLIARAALAGAAPSGAA